MPQASSRDTSFAPHPPGCKGCRKLADRPGDFLEATFGLSSTETARSTRLIITDSRIPKCPLCRTQMLKDHGTKGPFWSCARFPHCKGSRPP